MLKNLKEQALKPPKGLPTTAWTVYVAEKTSAAKGEGRKLETMIAGLAAEFKSMVPVELEVWNYMHQSQCPLFPGVRHCFALI